VLCESEAAHFLPERRTSECNALPGASQERAERPGQVEISDEELDYIEEVSGARREPPESEFREKLGPYAAQKVLAWLAKTTSRDQRPRQQPKCRSENGGQKKTAPRGEASGKTEKSALSGWRGRQRDFGRPQKKSRNSLRRVIFFEKG